MASCVRGQKEEDSALVCVNGHVIKAYGSRYIQDGFEKHCRECGGLIIHSCPFCNREIPGGYFSSYETEREVERRLSNFCESCGKPFPWAPKYLIEIEEEINKMKIDEHDKEEGIKLLKKIEEENGKRNADTASGFNNWLSKVREKCTVDLPVDLLEQIFVAYLNL